MAPVRIRWMGHSGFLIQDGGTAMVDPWLEGNPKAPCGIDSAPAADLILLTHNHSDHAADAAALARRTGALIVAIYEFSGDLRSRGVPARQLLPSGGMNIGGTVEILGFSITMTQAHHSSTLGAPVGYVIRTPSGVTIYHSGDTGIFAGMSLLGELYPVDVALLPIGSVFTMDYRQAAKACALLKAKAVIPMHYGTFPVLEPTADRFVAELSKVSPGTRPIVLTPGEETTV